MLSPSLVRAEIVVDGVVQGVGFRYFVRTIARELHLCGWTENLADGRVRTVAEGAQSDVLRLYALLQQGPPRAHVRQHSLQWLDIDGTLASFDIRR